MQTQQQGQDVNLDCEMVMSKLMWVGLGIGCLQSGDHGLE